jgi:hypothetical protein
MQKYSRRKKCRKLVEDQIEFYSRPFFEVFPPTKIIKYRKYLFFKSARYLRYLQYQSYINKYEKLNVNSFYDANKLFH